MTHTIWSPTSFQGAALVFALEISGFPAPPPDDIAAFVLASFIAGVTINRLGSLVVDPVLRSRFLPFLKPKNYKSFVTSEKDDPKLEILVANAGLYRTLLTAGIVYFGLLGISRLAGAWKIDKIVLLWLLLSLAMIVFLFALQKEDNYIHQRLSLKDKTDSKTCDS